jgi:hypothetical protein
LPWPIYSSSAPGARHAVRKTRAGRRNEVTAEDSSPRATELTHKKLRARFTESATRTPVDATASPIEAALNDVDAAPNIDAVNAAANDVDVGATANVDQVNAEIAVNVADVAEEDFDYLPSRTAS